MSPDDLIRRSDVLAAHDAPFDALEACPYCPHDECGICAPCRAGSDAGDAIAALPADPVATAALALAEWAVKRRPYCQRAIMREVHTPCDRCDAVEAWQREEFVTKGTYRLAMDRASVAARSNP